MDYGFCIRQFGMAAFSLLIGSLWPALASDAPTLKIGDRPPPLRIGGWVQGDPIKEFEAGKTYVVEFWATWCPPCREAIPHLNELQKKYADKGLVVVGQSVWQEDDRAVTAFVKRMGDKMAYRVALDDKSDESKGAMASLWLESSGSQGIPQTFLIDPSGRIAWIGHPFRLDDSLIEEVISGKHDISQAAEDFAKSLKAEAAQESLEQALTAKDWDLAQARLDECVLLLPEAEQHYLIPARYRIARGQKGAASAEPLATGLLTKADVEKGMMFYFAYLLLSFEDVVPRELELAEEMLTRANQLYKSEDSDILELLARAQFMRGKKDEAVATLKTALPLVDEPKEKERVRADLESYKAGKLPALPGQG